MRFSRKSFGKSNRTMQRVNRALGLARPAGRPPAAVDSAFREMYVKVKKREITMQMAADQIGCSVRTLERHFKKIKEEHLHVLTKSQPKTGARSGRSSALR